MGAVLFLGKWIAIFIQTLFNQGTLERLLLNRIITTAVVCCLHSVWCVLYTLLLLLFPIWQ